MTGHGGWPMTAFLTPAGEPFYCGTYFPPAPRHGMPSFQQILGSIVSTWQERRAEVLEAGAHIVAELTERSGLPAGEAPPTAGSSARRCAGSPGTRTGSTAGSAVPRSSRRRWCSNSFCGTPRVPGTGPRYGSPRPRSRRWRGAGCTTRSARVRPLLHRRRLGGAALREDAVRQRAPAAGLPALVAADRRTAGSPGGRGDRRVDAARAANVAGRVGLRAGRGQRGRGGQVLRVDARRAALRARRRGRRLGHGAPVRHRLRHLRARVLGAAAPRGAAGRGCRTLVRPAGPLARCPRAARAPVPRRQGRRGLERAGGGGARRVRRAARPAGLGRGGA
jgi:hypothetical protein